MTQATYIEPEGFKGTRGEFSVAGHLVCVKHSDVAIGECFFRSSKESDQERKANALLFAASKDLLRGLQASQGLLELLEFGFDENRHPDIYRQINEAINANDTAIKKALGNLSNTTDNG